MPTRKATKKSVKSKSLTPPWTYDITVVVTRGGKLTIPPGPLLVIRGRTVVWTIENRDSIDLTVEVKNFVPSPRNRHAPRSPISTTGPELVPAGGQETIIGKVKSGRGPNYTYDYEIAINGTTYDPEIVVCDEEPVERAGKPAPPVRPPKKKVAKK